MMGQVAPGTPSNLSPSVVAQLQQDMMGMPLDQLQQYAQQHMDDPVYGSTIVSMASYVANMKKAAQIPPINATQPSVAQQALQGIAPQQAPQGMPMQAPQARPPQGPVTPALPEDQGIGQLMAKNIENMASGGIVGYAGGGHVPSYAGITDGSFVMPKSQSVLGDVPIYTDTPLLPQQGAPENNQVPILRRLGASFYENVMQPHPIDPRTLASTPSVVPNTATNLAPAGPNPTDARLAAGTQTPPGGPVAAPAPALSLSQPPAATPAGPGATGNITSSNSAMNQGLGSFVSPTGKMIADAKKALGDDASMTLKDHVAQAQGMLPTVYGADDADLAIQTQKFKDAVGGDPAFKKDLDRLDNLDSKLEKNKQDSVGINTLLAGLSMIRSGNPWEAIAQGAGTGLKSYKDDMDKIDKAQEEHEKMRQNLDVAAMANNMGFTRMAADSVKEAKSAQVRSAEAALSAGSHAFDAEQQRMTTLAGENIRGQYGLQQAAIGANAPSQEIKTLSAFANNPQLAEQYKNSPQYQAQLRNDIVSAMNTAQKTLGDLTASEDDRAEARKKIVGYQNQLQSMFNQNAPLPAGLPTGAKFVGTSGGKRVYELPNGKQVVEQ
jgi:hypothetical protein